MIESVTMRMHGHSASDDASYVPKEMLDRWKQKDPVLRCERALLAEHLLDEEGRRALEDNIRRKIEEAVREAEASPSPEGPEAAEGVYAP